MTTTTDLRLPPTDEELMLFVDEELALERRAEVEAHLTNDSACRRKVLALRLAGAVLREAADEAPFPDGIADAVMREVDALDRPGARVVRLAAARTTSPTRRIYTLAAAALAAAAALTLWARGGTDAVEPLAARPPPVDVAASAREPREPRPLAAPSSDEGGAEVAAVDFGARTGSIFYVPTEAAEPTVVAVVWISDAESAAP